MAEIEPEAVNTKVKPQEITIPLQNEMFAILNTPSPKSMSVASPKQNHSPALSVKGQSPLIRISPQRSLNAPEKISSNQNQSPAIEKSLPNRISTQRSSNAAEKILNNQNPSPVRSVKELMLPNRVSTQRSSEKILNNQNPSPVRSVKEQMLPNRVSTQRSSEKILNNQNPSPVRSVKEQMLPNRVSTQRSSEKILNNQNPSPVRSVKEQMSPNRVSTQRSSEKILNNQNPSPVRSVKEQMLPNRVSTQRSSEKILNNQNPSPVRSVKEQMSPNRVSTQRSSEKILNNQNPSPVRSVKEQMLPNRVSTQRSSEKILNNQNPSPVRSVKEQMLPNRVSTQRSSEKILNNQNPSPVRSVKEQMLPNRVSTQRSSEKILNNQNPSPVRSVKEQMSPNRVSTQRSSEKILNNQNPSPVRSVKEQMLPNRVSTQRSSEKILNNQNPSHVRSVKEQMLPNRVSTQRSSEKILNNQNPSPVRSVKEQMSPNRVSTQRSSEKILNNQNPSLVRSVKEQMLPNRDSTQRSSEKILNNQNPSPVRSVKKQMSPNRISTQRSSEKILNNQNPSPVRSVKEQMSPNRARTQRSSNAAEKISHQSGTSAIETPVVQNAPAHHKAANRNQNFNEAVSSLEPRSLTLSDHINELAQTVNKLSRDITNPLDPVPDSNTDKIANMSKILTDEASALRKSIRSLSEDIVKTKQQLCGVCEIKEDVNFPYHLFLIEIIVNKIHMKCDCFDLDYNNLVITATFLGKQPVALYDSSYGKLDNLTKINVGKSILFAMTYDKICSIKDFEVVVELTKQPPCSSCVQRIGETHMDFTSEFVRLREELCQKWIKEQPDDNIVCTTSSPLSKNMYYVTCGDVDHQDSIGVIEISARMSFLGKEITTAFSSTSKPQCTSQGFKDDRGMTMYSCQNVEMDDQGKVLLDEEVLKRSPPCQSLPISDVSSLMSPKKYYESNNYNSRYDDDIPKYDEIFTKMNANELKIKVPKSTRIERMGKYDKIQELCTCESTPYNTGEQLQFELPRDLCGPDKSHRPHTANFSYKYNGCDKSCEPKNRKVINVTPTNCPVPVAMEKMVHQQKDVFILKIGKKLETKDKKTELEIELTTPKAPDKPADKVNDLGLQCSTEKLLLLKKIDSKTGKKKEKGKDKKGGKVKKGAKPSKKKGKKK